jgi:hypothetical protein
MLGTLNRAANALSRRSNLQETDRPITHNAILRKDKDSSIVYNYLKLARIATVTELRND